MSTKNKSRSVVTAPPWAQRVSATRFGIVRTLCDIERGEMDGDDFDKLRNFCLFALKLMEQKGPVPWDEAKAGASADYTAALIHETAAPDQRSQGRASGLVESARAVGKLRASSDMDEDIRDAYMLGVYDAIAAIKDIAP